MEAGSATAMQQAQHADYGIGNQAGKRPPPSPVDADLAKELSVRADEAAAEATWHEEAAERWRAVQRACMAGLEQISAPTPDVPGHYPR